MSDDSDLHPAAETLYRPSTPTPQAANRFTPGTLVAGRYRIIALLGRGGMGDVYRADDVKLGHPVALKFLPAGVAEDPAVLERLFAEVRLGRQISHPNVCRLFDIVEADGHHFIAMEYVDGEDLASLLRRIGRLPGDKALSLARDIASALTAAHDRGIIHRDLKPANVMIDGRGNARVTDFGLAAAADELTRSHEIAGTPAYMSPEQLEGGAVDERSDVYAFGTLLYEMLTGRRLFDGASLARIREQHSSVKSRPATHGANVDPAVERLVLQCLEEDPAERPRSMRAVLAALPGGDPLQAVIDAGETPSPEMVAAAGKSGELSAGAAWTLLLATLGVLLLSAAIQQRIPIEAYLARLKSREALRDRAAELASRFAPDAPRGDWKSSWIRNAGYVDHLETLPESERLRALNVSPPAPLLFSYRQSPIRLMAGNAVGRVLQADPAENVPGMLRILTDQEGRLMAFRRVPEQRRKDGRTPAPVDWAGFFREAGLDIATFHTAPAQWAPPYGSDRQFAWIGTHPGRPDLPLRIEAASFDGTAVWFELFDPWRRALPPVVPRPPFGVATVAVMRFAGLIVAAIFARRNVLHGRGDRRGAIRIAAAVFLLGLAGRLAAADHIPSFYEEWVIVLRLAGAMLVEAGAVWLTYLAIEPYVRRRWPRMLIGLSRLLAGRRRDPLVGREVLVGCVVGVGTLCLADLPDLLWGIATSSRLTLEWMESPAGLVTAICGTAAIGIGYAVGTVVILFLLRLVLRNDYAATAAMALLLGLGYVRAYGGREYVFGLVIAMVMMVVVRRVGVLAMAVAFSVQLMANTGLTLDFDRWYAGRGVVVIAVIFLMAAYGFFVALAGKPAFGTMALDDDREHAPPV